MSDFKLFFFVFEKTASDGLNLRLGLGLELRLGLGLGLGVSRRRLVTASTSMIDFLQEFKNSRIQGFKNSRCFGINLYDRFSTDTYHFLLGFLSLLLGLICFFLELHRHLNLLFHLQEFKISRIQEFKDSRIQDVSPSRIRLLLCLLPPSRLASPPSTCGAHAPPQPWPS